MSQCEHKIEHMVPETYQFYSDRCKRSAKTGMKVCWQHTADKLEEQDAVAHRKATA